jgi:hypothetical protein
LLGDTYPLPFFFCVEIDSTAAEADIKRLFSGDGDGERESAVIVLSSDGEDIGTLY